MPGRYRAGGRSGSAAVVAAGVRESLPRLRDELPVVACRSQAQLQDAEGVRVPNFGAGAGRRRVALAAGPDDELTNAGRRSDTAGVHLRPALVVVIVAVQDHVGAVRDRRVPERQGRTVLVGYVRPVGEVRVVPVDQGAPGVVGGEVVLEPAGLGGGGDIKKNRIKSD